MSFVNKIDDYHEGFEDGFNSKNEDLVFLINKILNVDLLFDEWSNEDKKKYEEIKERYLNDN